MKKYIACKNRKTKLICIKEESGLRTQYTTWSMLKYVYKHEYGVILPPLNQLEFEYEDIMKMEDCAIFMA